ncbi:SPOR domain-containing protein [Brachybacterium halotolerans subsp. kimchii]|uniref:SPOR domain-containing protein n=1 Tax=Brachybacterium halotolerans TaxID=2795215 RepID=A0ABS1B642_9MICO|nr:MULTISPECIES: SPOR domain-containing protein [Brachybacterium]MBK0330096.1 SPOR domain-containing protein [Brachybacterium halotolerans]MCG7308605.1 SPOR domain-containing protein [Brachybacterium sp. ACRRE]UEJ83121.1 SPOR domain-containing protein [Brachybacterium halotolerans subsp. kimchii]
MSQSEFYYNMDTGEVEEGKQSSGSELMGPYPTREKAASALRTAAQRNEAWEGEDEDWDEE